MQDSVRGKNKMEGFSKPPLPPLSSALWCRTGNRQETGNTIDRGLVVENPKTQSYEAEQSENIVPKEVSRVVVPDPAAHARELKRIHASRLYSRRHHQKQMHHMKELEMEKLYLEAETALFSPRFRYLNQKKKLFRDENDSLKQKIADCEERLKEKTAETENLLMEIELLKQFVELRKMQQAEAALNPPLAGSADYAMAFDPLAQHDRQVPGPATYEPSRQSLNPQAGLGSETVGFSDFYTPDTQLVMELPELDAQFSSDPNLQVDESVGFSEFTADELAALVINPQIMTSDNVVRFGAGDYLSNDSMNLDSFDDSQKAAGPPSNP